MQKHICLEINWRVKRDKVGLWMNSNTFNIFFLFFSQPAFVFDFSQNKLESLKSEMFKVVSGAYSSSGHVQWPIDYII